MTNEARFTPGPWTATILSGGEKSEFKIEAGGRVIARYLAFSDHNRFEHETALAENVEANARLIAASPLLFEALTKLLADIQAQRAGFDKPYEVHKIIEEYAENALREAAGAAP